MEVNELYCIGSNKFGQAGAGKKYHNQSFATFTKIVFPAFIKQVVCGSHHTGLLTLQGFVYMMGSNINGVLGIPISNINYSYSPILVQNLNEVSKISAGHYHMCAISEGRLYSWGKGVDGQLGTGKFTNNNLPTQIDAFGGDVEDVSCGLNHTLVKLTNQKCYAFGNGIYGQLGIGSNKNSALPLLVKIDKVSQIAAGQNFSLFLKQGSIFGAGDNSTGQINYQLKRKYALQPTQIPIKGAVAIRACKFSVAVLQDKRLYVWGLKSHHQPLTLDSIDDYIMDIQIGGNIIYCMSSQGQLYEWKYNDSQFATQMSHSDLRDKTILGFSVGETHSIIIGDIIETVPLTQTPLRVLQNLSDFIQKEDKSITPKQSGVRMQKFKQNTSEAQSINSEHLSRTPSSIMREPNNFLKGQTKVDNVQVTQFGKNKSLSLPNVQNSKFNEIQVKQCMKKVEEIMNMLNKTSNLSPNQSNVNELSRKSMKSKLNRSLILHQQGKGKQNIRKDIKNEKSNKQLIMQLRQKQLKISELQQKLSRKEVQIESQRQLINLLRKINSQNQ